MAGANRYLEKRYRRAHNSEFAVRAAEPASAFVEFIGANLGDILCERFERTVGNDNCVRFNALSLQIPADQHQPLISLQTAARPRCIRRSRRRKAVAA